MSGEVFIIAPGWPYLVFGFLIGTIPFGLIVGRLFFRADLRTAGSGNIGAANALRTLGPVAGLTVLALDALKGAGAVLATTNHIFLWTPAQGERFIGHAHVNVASVALAPLAALAAMIGHCYSPWLRFRGGKGVATFLGATLVLSWASALTFVIVWLAIVLACGYSSLGSLLGAVAAAVALIVASRHDANWYTVLFALLSVALIIWRHRTNIARLRDGTESRLSLLRK